MIMTRLVDETMQEFLERAAEAARRQNGSVETEGGTMCPTCTPSSAYETPTLEIVTRQSCYNCSYGEAK
jgi:hypothetical protein